MCHNTNYTEMGGTIKESSMLLASFANLLLRFNADWVQFWFLEFEVWEFGHIDTLSTTALLQKCNIQTNTKMRLVFARELSNDVLYQHYYQHTLATRSNSA